MRIVQILQNSPNHRTDLLSDGLESVMVCSFIDTLRSDEIKSNDVKKIIINDYMIKRNILSKKTHKNEITLDFLACQYLALIENEVVSDKVISAKSKNDLKGILYLDELFSDMGLGIADKLIKGYKSIKGKVKILSQYKDELDKFTKTSEYINGMKADFSDYSVENIKSMKESYDFLESCYDDYSVLKNNFEYEKKIANNHDKFRRIKKDVKKWMRGLKPYLDGELKGVDTGLSTCLTLAEGAQKVNMYGGVLDELSKKYATARYQSSMLDNKLSVHRKNMREIERCQRLDRKMDETFEVLQRDTESLHKIKLNKKDPSITIRALRGLKRNVDRVMGEVYELYRS